MDVVDTPSPGGTVSMEEILGFCWCASLVWNQDFNLLTSLSLLQQLCLSPPAVVFGDVVLIDKITLLALVEEIEVWQVQTMYLLHRLTWEPWQITRAAVEWLHFRDSEPFTRKIKLHRDPSTQLVLGTTAVSDRLYSILVLLYRKWSRNMQMFLSSLIFSLTVFLCGYWAGQKYITFAFYYAKCKIFGFIWQP